jgi:hypothetical protein
VLLIRAQRLALDTSEFIAEITMQDEVKMQHVHCKPNHN